MWDDVNDTIPHPQTNAVNGPNPQLDANNNPQYGPAKAYGAGSPDKAAAFRQYVGRFQWSWDTASSFLPAAHPAILYSPTGITFDASSSTPGLNSYGSNTFVGFGWDLDGNGTVDLTGGSRPLRELR